VGNPLDGLSPLHNHSRGLARLKTSSLFFDMAFNKKGGTSCAGRGISPPKRSGLVSDRLSSFELCALCVSVVQKSSYGLLCLAILPHFCREDFQTVLSKVLMEFISCADFFRMPKKIGKMKNSSSIGLVETA
jgi:hypothetical protein